MSTLLDEETVVIDGLEFEVECSRMHDTAAEFSVSCRSCRNTELWCGEHLDYWVRVSQRPGVRITCEVCGKTSKTFDDAVEVVPL